MQLLHLLLKFSKTGKQHFCLENKGKESSSHKGLSWFAFSSALGSVPNVESQGLILQTPGDFSHPPPGPNGMQGSGCSTPSAMGTLLEVRVWVGGELPGDALNAVSGGGEGGRGGASIFYVLLLHLVTTLCMRYEELLSLTPEQHPSCPLE